MAPKGRSMGKMNEDPLRPGSANLVFFIGSAAIGAERKLRSRSAASGFAPIAVVADAPDRRRGDRNAVVSGRCHQLSVPRALRQSRLGGAERLDLVIADTYPVRAAAPRVVQAFFPLRCSSRGEVEKSAEDAEDKDEEHGDDHAQGRKNEIAHDADPAAAARPHLEGIRRLLGDVSNGRRERATVCVGAVANDAGVLKRRPYVSNQTPAAMISVKGNKALSGRR